MKENQLRTAQIAIKQGDKVKARTVLRTILIQNPKNEEAWMLLAGVVEKREHVSDCLERVLRINPQNEAARRALSTRTIEKTMPLESYDGVLITDRAIQEKISDIDSDRKSKYLSGYWGRRSEKAPYRMRKPVNWPLIIGSIIVFLFVLLAIAGPSLAPRDPIENSALLKVGDTYIKPPYPLFTPGFPLGSGDMGRDLFSRLLWAIRPTFTLVLVVAILRLVLGTSIGMVAGWSTGFIGHTLDTAIAVAISIPVIIVALCGIAAVGEELGIWAFIVGLCLTGWVGTARIVREQTQGVRDQEYIQAAHAMGASNRQILFHHIIRQIRPLLSMLFVFEISATLMLIAALGFLGYYIGGDIWVTITDVTAQAISGMPELGQMLATTGMSILRPWPLMVIGGVVFLVVLGFNLLGEGLRRQSNQYSLGRRSAISEQAERLQIWFDENAWYPLSNLSKTRTFRLGLAGILIIIVLIAGWVWWRTIISTPSVENQMVAAISENPTSPATCHDPYGSRSSDCLGPRSAGVAWIFEDDNGFNGGPTVGVDGTVYVSSGANMLYAITPDGEVRWKTILTSTPVGKPATSEMGQIYVTDKDGGLTALSSNGKITWQYQPQDGEPAKAGPIVSPDGNIYYATGLIGRDVQAVSKDGKALWRVHTPGDAALSDQLRLSPSGDLVFLMEDVIDVRDGSLIDTTALGEMDQHYRGADGNTYSVKEHEVIHWKFDETSIDVINEVTWDHSKFTIARTPKEVGVTRDQVLWLFYAAFIERRAIGEDTGIVWLNLEGQELGKTRYPTRNSKVIAVDRQAVVFTCGNLEHGYGDLECQAFSLDSSAPLWTLILEQSHQVMGGTLVSGRLYVTSREGQLYAIGELEQLTTAPPIAQATQVTPQEAAGEDDRVVYLTAEPTLAQVTSTPPEEPTAKTDSLLDLAGEPIGPQEPQLEVIFEDRALFTGKPVVGEDGTVYIGSKSGKVYALDPSGEILWEVTPPAKPVSAPALDLDGNLYVADEDGGLSALTPGGEILWRFQTEEGSGLTSPVISPDGVLFYLVGTYSKGYIQAVSASGKGLWLTELHQRSFFYPLGISPKGDFVFYHDEVFDASDGSRLEFDLSFAVDKFFGGEDSKTYLWAGNTVVEWRYIDSKFEMTEQRVLSPIEFNLNDNDGVGVTPEGVVWLQGGTSMFWFSKDGKALAAHDYSEVPWDSMQYREFETLISVDRDYTVYVCGGLYCAAFSPRSKEPLWDLDLIDWGDPELSKFYEEILGGALAPGRLYIATSKGYLYLIHDEEY
ncbi:MAG: PQQ-binding-like beta-propeller repeat protein [Anaerolineales bacterium]